MAEKTDTVQLSIKEIAKFVKQKTDEMSSKIEEMKDELRAEIAHASKPEGRDSKKISELDERISREIKRIDELVESNLSSTVEQGVKKYLERTSDIRAELKNDISNMRRDFITQIHYLDSKLSDVKTDMRSLDTNKIDAKLHGIESKLADMQNARARLNEIEEQLVSLRSTISSKALQSGSGESSAMVEAHVKRIDDLERRLSEMQKALSRGTDSVMLTKLKSEILEQLDNIKSDADSKLKYLEDTMRVETKTLTADTKQIEDTTHKFDAVSRELAMLKKQADSMGTQLREVNEQYSKMRGAPESYEELLDDVLEMKRNFEEESALRVSNDKALQDMEKKINEFSETLSKIKEAEKFDYSKMMESVQADKSMTHQADESAKMEAMKIVTKHLDEFAKTMDRRLPNIATKDEVAQAEARLEQIVERKMRAMRPVIVNPMLERRIADMEKTMRDMMYILKSLNRAQPFVVE